MNEGERKAEAAEKENLSQPKQKRRRSKEFSCWRKIQLIFAFSVLFDPNNLRDQVGSIFIRTKIDKYLKNLKLFGDNFAIKALQRHF